MKAVFPLPTGNMSNGEFDPAPQTQDQRRVEKIIVALADRIGRKQGLGRRKFLRSLCGLAAAFLAMNEVYGPVFQVSEAEAADPEQARERSRALSGQFIFDDQVHFVHDQFQFKGLLDLRSYAAEHWNPELKGKQSFEKIRFRNFLREVFLESDTKIALLSGAPAENKMDWFLSNDELADARALVNSIAGSRRMLCHAVITPGRPGWLAEMDRAIEVLKPDSWKGYTVGDPLSGSPFPYRLDDEKLMYPAYEKIKKAGIKNVCIHKGLVPNDYLTSFENWKYAKVDDLGKAAQDWPDLNFIIYHAALKPLNEYPESHLERFERTGRIDWVTDLAEIPSKAGVSNVYADLGTCFASCAVTHPRHAAALVGTLVKGLGSDHVVWGTDSVWYGSPQWQIEALRRLEVPQDMQDRFGFAPLGGPDSPVKRQILGTNSARLYGLEVKSSAEALKEDRFALFNQGNPLT
jgi:predicted TIM-barrel fold metal-dependent hydrolase